MPSTAVPRARGVTALQAEIARIEADGGVITGTTLVDDQWLLVWAAKPKPGRPKKVETR